MQHDELTRTWMEFADKHDAKAKLSREGTRTLDNRFAIKKDGEFEILFTWGDTPNVSRYITATTEFRFPINAASNLKFQMLQKGLITFLVSILEPRVKTGNARIDEKYCFISNHKELFAVRGMVESFDEGYDGTSFVLELEGDETGLEGKRIYILLNKVRMGIHELERFYTFGRALQKQANKLSETFCALS